MKPIRLVILAAALVAVSPALAQVDFTGRTLLKSGTTMEGSPVVYPRTDSPEVTAMLMEIGPGGETGWHMHTVLTFVYVLDGTVEVQERGRGDGMTGGMTHTHTAGEAFLHEVNAWHNGRNRGPTLTKILVVSAGERGRPVMVREAQGQGAPGR